MHWLELKIPPPLVALSTALFMWLTARLVGPLDVQDGLRVGAALVVACTGVALDFAGLVSFMRAKTTVNPIRATSTSSLVVTGLYRFSRNPMYLGQLLLLLGWATFLANGVAYLLAPVFVLYINRFQILPEERILSAKFGAQFDVYKTRVRRWV
jgi:protein-S-isoprenylcysteine O-methyltransferase Ste14